MQKCHRRVWRRTTESSPSPSPLDRATSVGVSFPSFNFIEPKVPKRPSPGTSTVHLPSLTSSKRNQSPPPTNGLTKNPLVSALNCDAIVYHTLLRFASDLDEPTMTEDSKMTRLWQALQRHSEAGRFSQHAAYTPNPICSFMAMEILQQILQASGVSLMLMNLLIGAIGNSIFQGYEPEKPQCELTQYADIVVRTLEEKHSTTTTADGLAISMNQPAACTPHQAKDCGGTTEDKAGLVTAVYRSVEGAVLPALIMETLEPFFSDELLLLLWNATAKVSATQHLSHTEFPTSTSDDDDEASQPLTTQITSRNRAFSLATRVLQERVRLMLRVGQTLSAEEKAAVATSLVSTTESSGLPLKGVLQTLEDMYVSEHGRDRSSSPSPRRSLFVSTAARRSSVAIRQEGPRPSSRQRLASIHSTLAPTPEQSAPLSASPLNVSVPDVLLDALAEKQHVAATEQSQLLIEQLSSDYDEILRQCEVIFDLLCEDPAVSSAPKRMLDAATGDSSAQAILDTAKERLCDLLCTFVDTPSFIIEKFEKSEADKADRAAASQDLNGATNTHALVQLLIQRQRQDPAMLGTAINLHPEILLSAIAHNNGILRFAITRFTPLVKRFLRLDLKACDYLDGLVQTHKGIQLLWGTNAVSSVGVSQTGQPPRSDGVAEPLLRRRSSTMDGGTNRGVVLTPIEGYLIEWFTAHTEDLAQLSLKRPDLLKPLFMEMHTVGDAGAFHKIMVQLASTKGLQNFLHRSSISTLEKIAQDDPAEVGRLLREIFGDGGNDDLLHQLQASPYLTTCLSEFHPTAIHDVIASDMETWRHYFIDTVLADDGMLEEILTTRTEELDGGEALVRLFTAVLLGSTAGLNLQALDFGASAVDVAMAKTRDGLSRRKMAQCLYLRGGGSVFRALVAQLIGTVGFHPHELMAATTLSASSRTLRGSLPASVSAAASASASASASALAAAGHVSNRGKAKKATTRGTSSSPAKKRPLHPISRPSRDDVSIIHELPSATSDSVAASLQEIPSATTSAARLMENMPLMWRSFTLLFVRQQQQRQLAPSESHTPMLTLAQAKTLVLDLWIEFLKVDTVQLDNACLYSLAPFVCDYLVTRYDAPSVVGAWLFALTEATAAYPDDPRLAFFASSCGFHDWHSTREDGYDTFLYYAHALGHILFSHMKIFKPECRLEETLDGSCPIEKRTIVATAARLFDHRLLSGSEIETLLTRLDTLPAIDDRDRIELDDAMAVFLDHWRIVQTHIDARYRQAFGSHDPSGSNRIGLEQFIKIVTSVTQNGISPRDCLLVFCDVGLELLDVDTLVRVTRVYHLRLFHAHLPELALDESELQELTQSVGRTNIFSMARETEDLDRFWRGLGEEVQAQLVALHQSQSTKTHLKKQSALIEKLLYEIHTSPPLPPPTSSSPLTADDTTGRPRSQQQQRTLAVAVTTATGPQLLHKAWTELRACAKMLQAAKVTQHYLSRLYIQTCVVRWIHHMRKKRLSQGRSNAALLSTSESSERQSSQEF